MQEDELTATLVIWAFKDEGRLALDVKLKRA
jgi:hypothetical protein